MEVDKHKLDNLKGATSRMNIAIEQHGAQRLQVVEVVEVVLRRPVLTLGLRALGRRVLRKHSTIWMARGPRAPRRSWVTFSAAPS